ncbi:hypothetical protein Csa_019750 [Cucumis sativus]|uniref:Uncharacterized protein n=1 Tax=Cucumis sativus TaxID=3659 RepID=A0A0A0LWM8_CUCSA|nr:hypothetical protein Csa_019750 [Cucumis sativus]
MESDRNLHYREGIVLTRQMDGSSTWPLFLSSEDEAGFLRFLSSLDFLSLLPIPKLNEDRKIW